MFFNGNMTLSLRNGILTATLGFILVLTLGYGALAFLMVSQEGWSAAIGQGTLLDLLIETAPLPVGALLGVALLRRAFRKSSNPESFFFALFLASFSAEALVLAQAWITFHGYPAYFTGLLTRIVWAFRVMGLGFLFCGSLFQFEYGFRKFGQMVLWTIVVAIAVVVWLPLHSSTARNHLLYAVGDAPGMVLFSALIAVVVAAGYLYGGYRPRRNGPSRSRGWAAVFFLGGWSLCITIGPWAWFVAAPGLALALRHVDDADDSH